jgi:hypothetical protein
VDTQRPLALLAVRKRELRRVIAERRHTCAGQLEHAVKPLVWLDEKRAQWRGVSPLVKVAVVPLGVWVARWFFPKSRVAGTLLKWAPLAWSLFKGARATR